MVGPVSVRPGPASDVLADSMPHAHSDGSGFTLLVASDLASMLNVTERWVRDATREGRIPHVRLGRYVRYRREAVLAWISTMEVEGRGRR
jgi:excisionase family DNA binding protein